MANYYYSYGSEMTQDAKEAKGDIVTAFDLLIAEMSDYMRIRDLILGKFETDEYQAASKQALLKLQATMQQAHGEGVAFEPSNPEVNKQSVRDLNTAEIGGYEKRLGKLQGLRVVFAQTKPEDVTQEIVHEAYRIIKTQVLRCATDLCRLKLPDIKQRFIKLTVYSKALLSCGRLDEIWDEDFIFPFADVDF